MAEPTVTTTTTETPEAPKPVQFDDLQKARINEIISDAVKRAGAEARAEAKRLQDELDTLKRTQAPAPDQSVELQATKAELAAMRKEQAESALKGTLLSAVSGMGFFDPKLGADLLAQNAKLRDGKVVFVNEAGEVELGSDFNPLTPSGAATRLAEQRPYLVRGDVKGGSGSVLADRVSTPPLKLEDIFGARSSGAAANALAMRSPAEYRRLKSLAQQRRLI